jgi:hypothetical protein
VGNPGSAEANESSGAESDQEELTFWWLREIYIQALAAGVTDEQYSGLTLTKIIAHIEAEKHRRYWSAKPVLTAMMPHLDKKAVQSIVRGGKAGGDTTASRALARMLEEYAPASFTRSVAAMQQQAPQPIPDLPWEAAQGVVIAFSEGKLTDELWASISQWYPRIAATAKRGLRREDR